MHELEKIVITFWGVSLFFIISVTKTHDEVPLRLYLSFLFIWILFPMCCFFIAEKVKQIFVYMKENKDLIHTIRTILLLFPEGVIIRSIDPVTKETILKFANDAAKKFNLDKWDYKEDNGSIEVMMQNENNSKNIFNPNLTSTSHSDTSIKLFEFLRIQEEKLINQIIFIKLKNYAYFRLLKINICFYTSLHPCCLSSFHSPWYWAPSEWR